MFDGYAHYDMNLKALVEKKVLAIHRLQVVAYVEEVALFCE